MRTVKNTPGFMVNIPTMMDELFGKEFSAPTGRAAVNIIKNESDYQIELIAPGFNKEDINIKLDGRQLTISAEVSEEKDSKTYSIKEFKKASFSRTFTLPENEINDEDIQASFNNGILTLTLPKREEALPKAPKKIAIV